MKTLSLLAISFLTSVGAQAREQRIQIDSYSYPSPASIHLDGLQQGLASKAVEVCGSRKLVLGLKDIRIRIKGGIDPLVGQISDDGVDLGLVYPKMVASEILVCKD